MIALLRESNFLTLCHDLSRFFHADWPLTTDVQMLHLAPGLRLLLYLRKVEVCSVQPFCQALFCHPLQSKIQVAILQAQS